jgi:hypothetical protein
VEEGRFIRPFGAAVVSSADDIHSSPEARHGRPTGLAFGQPEDRLQPTIHPRLSSGRTEERRGSSAFAEDDGGKVDVNAGWYTFATGLGADPAA